METKCLVLEIALPLGNEQQNKWHMCRSVIGIDTILAPMLCSLPQKRTAFCLFWYCLALYIAPLNKAKESCNKSLYKDQINVTHIITYHGVQKNKQVKIIQTLLSVTLAPLQLVEPYSGVELSRVQFHSHKLHQAVSQATFCIEIWKKAFELRTEVAPLRNAFRRLSLKPIKELKVFRGWLAAWASAGPIPAQNQWSAMSSQQYTNLFIMSMPDMNKATLIASGYYLGCSWDYG